MTHPLLDHYLAMAEMEEVLLPRRARSPGGRPIYTIKDAFDCAPDGLPCRCYRNVAAGQVPCPEGCIQYHTDECLRWNKYERYM